MILITQHSLHKGTRGLIVNLLSSDSVARTFKVSLDVSSAFGSNPVFCGGPVSSRHAEVEQPHLNILSDLMNVYRFCTENLVLEALI